MPSLSLSAQVSPFLFLLEGCTDTLENLDCPCVLLLFSFLEGDCVHGWCCLLGQCLVASMPSLCENKTRKDDRVATMPWLEIC